MHKIDKFLARLSDERRRKILDVIERMGDGNFSGLDVRKLRGALNRYRVRIGNIRITFIIDESGIRILGIDNRSENTYRDV